MNNTSDVAREYGWQFRGANNNGHRVFYNPSEPWHFITVGSGKKEQLDAMKLDGRIRQCANGSCNHVSPQEYGLPDEAAMPGAGQPIVPGSQVTYNGTTQWVTEIDGSLAVIHDESTGQEDVVPLQQLVPLRQSNILDPIEKTLDQTVYNGITPKYSVQKFITDMYYRALDKEFGVEGQQWADLYITGSLTTYQYSVTSDCDMSVFPNYDLFWKQLGLDPDSARKRLIHLSIEHIDGTFLPGTTHPLQFFVVPNGIHPHDLYQPGLRSAFDLHDKLWFQKPEKDRVHDIAIEYPDLFKRAEDIGDKLTQMLDAGKDDAARELWHQIHKKRQLDQQAGLGDFCEGNIVYKYLLNEGLFDRIRSELGEYIARTGAIEWVGSEIDEGHADTRFPWIYVPETDRLVIGTPGSSHRTLAKFVPDADQGTEWYGAYGSQSGKVTIFSQYDFDDFTYDDIDKDLIRNLRLAWPGASIWYNDIDGDRVKYDDTQYVNDANVSSVRTADLWEDRVSTKVIYDFDKDTITLGTQATQATMPDSKIIGEYADGRVTLYGVEKQWISPQYFHRLWSFSYPDKELKDVYYQREEGDVKLRTVRRPKRSKWSMAPKFYDGDSVIMKGYGESGRIKGEPTWDEERHTYWYYVDTYNQDGPVGLTQYPEKDMERPNRYDQPGEMTIKDMFGITPEGEEYFRNASN